MIHCVCRICTYAERLQVVSEIPESLEWQSVVNATVNADIRSVLPALNDAGVIAYTDGACIKNPGGPAGWSALLWAASTPGKTTIPDNAPCFECYGHIPKA